MAASVEAMQEGRLRAHALPDISNTRCRCVFVVHLHTWLHVRLPSRLGASSPHKNAALALHALAARMHTCVFLHVWRHAAPL